MTNRDLVIQKMYNLGYCCAENVKKGTYVFTKGTTLDRVHIVANTHSGEYYEYHEWLNHRSGLTETELMLISPREEKIIRDLF